MAQSRPKTIGFPDSPKLRIKFEAFADALKASLPEHVQHVETVGAYVEYLLLKFLLDEGRMVNTDTFLVWLSERDPILHQWLQENSYVFDVVCLDVVKKIAKAQSGHH